MGSEAMRVVVSAGGTGGHIYPALAIIHKIQEKEPNSQFLYIGTHNRMEKDIIPNYGIPFETIEIYGFYRKKVMRNVKTIRCFLKAVKTMKKRLKEFQPDVVLGVGGYVTAPVIYAAHSLKIPTFIHEQNSIPGKANLFLSRYVTKIGVSFESAKKAFPKEKVIFTGNPCSEEAILKKAIDKRELGLNPNQKLVLFVMGSLGSSKVNDFLVKTMTLFNQKKYEILFVTGKEDYEKIKEKSFPSNVHVVPYLEGMTRVMKKTDLMVSRAGASTLSEMIALEVPSILIPSPYVPNNHQYVNAQDLVKSGGALLVEEKELKGDIIVRMIDDLFQQPSKLETMRRSLRKLQKNDSATHIYGILREMSAK